MKTLFRCLAAILLVTSVSFAGGFQLGGHAAASFSNWWGDDSDDAPWGLGFNAGLAGKVNINQMLAVNPEADIALRRLSDDDATFSEWALEVPVLVRVQPVQQFFLEVGPSFNFNLSSEGESEADGVSVTRDMDDYVNTFEFGLVFGAGTSLPVGTGLDIDFRFNMGLTQIEKEIDSGFGESYQPDLKNFQFALGLTYWFL